MTSPNIASWALKGNVHSCRFLDTCSVGSFYIPHNTPRDCKGTAKEHDKQKEGGLLFCNVEKTVTKTNRINLLV